MKLSDLLSEEAALDPKAAAIDVSGVTADSRAIKPGDVFVAIAGGKVDGLKFATQAADAGAVAVVTERDGGAFSTSVPSIKVGNTRRALALMAAKFFPRQPGVIAAVTGTSGKTSVAAFTRQIWEQLGHAAASVGTIGVVSGTRSTYGSLTTPDPVALHRTLDELAGEGVTHLAIEASSHGLDQHRLDGLRIAAGAFTNLSRDHLDYHADLDDYLDAKLRLFSDLVAPDGTAVVSADHPESAAVVATAQARGLRVITVGQHGEGLCLQHAAIDGAGQRISIQHGGQIFDVLLPLVGGFQVENALVAAGLAIATGSEAAKVFPALGALQGAKGRLELVGSVNGASIIIDYAHKPDALEKVLAALRPYAANRLIVVFGAGGDRDPGKRPLMGAIATMNADRVIVTDDNPRSENPAAIRAAILAAAPGAVEIGDRGEAIHTAIADLRPGDVLLIAGKGHETGQIIGDRTLPFSDHEAVAAAAGEKVA